MGSSYIRQDPSSHTNMNTKDEAEEAAEACRTSVNRVLAPPGPNFEPGNPPDPEFTINLPGVICSQILSYLSWPDKLNLVRAIPKWEEHLYSVAAWPCFSCAIRNRKNMQFLLENAHSETCRTIKKYGHYFQRIRGDFYYFDFSTMGLEILDYISKYCKDLRALRLDHPVTFRYGSEEVLKKLIHYLKEITQNCKNLTRMAFSFQDYLPLSKRKGIDELLHRFVSFEERVTLLDFCYGYGTDFTTPSVKSLLYFHHLQVLKCPIQVLRNNIIICLAQHSLQELYLLNNDITLNEDFREKEEIDWNDIATRFPHLRVHYIINGRTFRSEDVAPNPLATTLVLDSLCNQVDAGLMEAISSNYSTSLRTFAHLATDWDYDPYEELAEVPEMYSDLAQHCTKLGTLLCAVKIPVEAIVIFAANRRLRNLWVDAEQILYERQMSPPAVIMEEEVEVERVDWWEGKVHDREGLNDVVSNILGFRWKPCTRNEIEEKTGPLLSV